MLLFRMGPRYLFFRSENINETTNFLEKIFNGKITNFQQGMEKASEYSTLCFITDINHKKTYIEDAKKIVLVNDVASSILSSIINNNAYDALHKIDMGPAAIIMRAPGNEHKLIDNLKRIFNAKEVDWIDGIGLGEKDNTIIALTNKALNNPVTELLDTKLLIPQPSRDVNEKLRLEGLRLITQSLDDSHWYELRINIYDSNGKYKENYDRLMYILSKLEMGLILGESWTKDYAVMLFSVMTYQIRLFTFFTPQEVKKVLMALEYTTDGKRLVDFDLYYKNKKVYWSDVNKTKRKKNKLKEAKVFRQSLFEKLKLEDIKTLEAMEQSIINSIK